MLRKGPAISASRFEYYDATREVASTTSTAKGWQVETAYSVLPNLDLMARHQQFESKSRGLAEDEIGSFNPGAKHYLSKKGTRAGTSLSINSLIRDADAGVTRGIFDERGDNVTGAHINSILMARLQVQQVQL